MQLTPATNGRLKISKLMENRVVMAEKLEKIADAPLTLAQMATLCGVSSVTLSKWLHDADAPPRRDGKFYLSDAGVWMRKVLIAKEKAGRYPYAPDGWGPYSKVIHDDPDLPENRAAAETRLRIAQANKVEMENDVTAGKLIPVDDVSDAWRTILSRVRTRLLKLPTTLAPLVFGDPDVLSVQAKLKEGVNDALSEASVDWRDADGVIDDE